MRLYWSCCCVGFLYLWRVGVALYLRGSWAFHCSGFSCCRALARGSKDFSSYSPRALEHGLSSCGTQAQLLWDMWDLPGPGIEPVSPASAGRFFTTEPSGMPQHIRFWNYYVYPPTLRCLTLDLNLWYIWFGKTIGGSQPSSILISRHFQFPQVGTSWKDVSKLHWKKHKDLSPLTLPSLESSRRQHVWDQKEGACCLGLQWVPGYCGQSAQLQTFSHITCRLWYTNLVIMIRSY